MALLKKKYDGNKAIDVREFAEEIARLTKSGPAGANQARRAIEQLSHDPNGKKLLAGAAKQAHLVRQSAGASLSDVRVHTGSNIANAGNQLGAAAFTTGSHVAFETGGPSTSGSERLLAHELTHAVQQRSGKKR